MASLVLAACGGGSDAPSSVSAPTVSTEIGAPQATGDTATDGFNWFNYRRQQLGIQILARNALIDNAALGHSNYQKLNNKITHEQTPGEPGFTGVTLSDRLTAANYHFTNSDYAYGEVISSTTSTSGFSAAEDLITAIYHRFVIFEPMFKEAGAGAATVPNGYTYFTTDFASNGLNKGLSTGGFVVYPFANQQNIPTIFYSDFEYPDPVPNQNAVGYPISVHANIIANLTVQSFTVQPRGGATMPIRLLTHATDAQTGTSVAAIVPLNVLASHTTYDVQFVGNIDGINVSKAWSFTTR